MAAQLYGGQPTLLSGTQPVPSEICFLCLPYKVRLLIYLYAGVFRECRIDLNSEFLLRGQGYLPCDPGGAAPFQAGEGSIWFCDCPKLPVTLLRVSRFIYNEVLPLLYGSNIFQIHQRGSRGGLRILHSLGTDAIASLRYLTIALSECACSRCMAPQAIEELQRWGTTHSRGRGIDDSSKDGSELEVTRRSLPLVHDHGNKNLHLLDDWPATTQLLTSCVSEGKLRLDLTCDIRSSDSVSHIAASLAILPRLSGCSVQLHRMPNETASLVAQRFARQLLGGNASRQPDNYNIPRPKNSKPVLPTEVIEKILSFSGLVAPNHLAWQPEYGFRPSQCCRKCVSSPNYCTCPGFHGAYSDSCTCWRVPFSYFLVSRRFLTLSKSVFYSRNTFVPLRRHKPCSLIQPPRCDTLPAVLEDPVIEFLGAIPPAAGPLLRSIGVITRWPGPGSLPLEGVTARFERQMARLVELCDTTRLTLHLYIFGLQPEAVSYFAERLIPLQLARLFVHYTIPPDQRDYNAKVATCEAIEQRVMGQGYDSTAQGKWATPGVTEHEPLYTRDDDSRVRPPSVWKLVATLGQHDDGTIPISTD